MPPATLQHAPPSCLIENPADRSIRGTPHHIAQFDAHPGLHHGSLFATSAFKRLDLAIGPLKQATFAGCMLGGAYQKYTTLAYTPDASPFLDPLDGPAFKCAHQDNHSKVAGGRAPGRNSFLSEESAAYPDKLNMVLSRSFTLARTGSSEPIANASNADPRVVLSQANEHKPVHMPFGPPDEVLPSSVHTTSHAAPPPSAMRDAASPGPAPSTTNLPGPSPIPFGGFDEPLMAAREYPVANQSTRAARASTLAQRNGGQALDSVAEESDAPYVSFTGTPISADGDVSLLAAKREPHTSRSLASQLRHACSDADDWPTSSPADVAEGAVAALMAELHHESTADIAFVSDNWEEADVPAGAKQLASGLYAFEVSHESLVANPTLVLIAQQTLGVNSADAVLHALRADSDGAPSTIFEARARGGKWPASIQKEMDNHKGNGSWTPLLGSQLPRGRRLHKLVWVFKVKRDGSCKSRLAVQGCTMSQGPDFDQVRATTMRYSSARALFSFAARNGCEIRSYDLVAAFLQGEFIDGEVVYTRMPPGFERRGSDGLPMICRVDKPIYGIPQASRRLQRKLYPWLSTHPLRRLDDADDCCFVYTDPEGTGEILVIGVYVDNLQIVHSAKLGDDGRAIDKQSFYHRFTTELEKDWDVLDEGPMVDLLGVQVRRNADSSITLHQEAYIDKLCEKFAPDGIDPKIANTELPYSSHFADHLAQAVCVEGPPQYPELVKPFQERCGCLMYCATACRVDIAYVTGALCRAMSKPTPELMHEFDVCLAYLARHRSTGLTYVSSRAPLCGYSDASHEVRNSTSGHIIMYGQATINWGSKKQNCVALSSMESELVALSEATKDMVYSRKLIGGFDETEIDGASSLFTDNKAARDTAYNPERHDKTKHIERRHFFVRDMVEKFEIVVPYVNTHDNIADFLTKALDKVKFQRFRAIIMNETPVARAQAHLARAVTHASLPGPSPGP